MIADLIDRARREPPHPVPGTTMILTCSVAEQVHWDRHAIEASFGFRIPDEIASLWDACGELRLYEDTTYGQWGLIIPSPMRILSLNLAYRQERAEDALPGDFVFAEFRGDLDLPILRADQSADDYGAVIVARDIGPRDEWDTAGRSVEDFLSRFMDAHGAMFWQPEQAGAATGARGSGGDR